MKTSHARNADTGRGVSAWMPCQMASVMGTSYKSKPKCVLFFSSCFQPRTSFVCTEHFDEDEIEYFPFSNKWRRKKPDAVPNRFDCWTGEQGNLFVLHAMFVRSFDDVVACAILVNKG